jgi:predicted phage terminase large subunit-like protein
MPGWTNDYVDFLGLKERPEGSVHEHSIDTAGIDRTQVGDHYDLIIVDDIHDENNSQTAEQIERVTDYLQTLAPYLDRKSTMPGGHGKIIYIGTRWNFGDAYEWLMNNEPSLSVSSNSCYDGPDGLLFPEELTHEFLASERARLKPRLFSSWYLNEPQADEDKIFKEEWKQIVNASYVKTRHGLGEVVFADDTKITVIPRLTLDPALGLSKNSDYVGICLMGWATDGVRYIIKTWRFRESPKQVIDRLIGMIWQYGVATLGVEGVAFQRIYGDMIRKHFVEKDINIPVIHIKTDTWKSKKKRVESLLEPHFAEGKIYILPGNELFISDFDHWPQLKYDDVIDSVAMQFEQAVMEPDIVYINQRRNRWMVHPDDREPQEQVYGTLQEIMPRRSYVGIYSG